MKRWRVLLVLLALLCFIAAAGCVPGEDEIAYPGDLVDDELVSGPDEAVEDPALADPDQSANTGQEPAPGGTQAPRTVTIKLYFSNQGAIEANTPGPTGFVTAVTRELPYTEGVLRLALQELIRGPLPGESAVGRTLPAATRILGLSIEDRVAVINFSSELLTAEGSPAGSLGGAVFLQSVVYTATQFPTVEAALVKVNGEPFSDGHYVWDQPVRRSDLP